MTTAPDLEDIRWLVSPDAAAWLDRAAGDAGSLTTLVERLRKELSPERAHLVLEQVELRRRAVDKFAQAPRMFFSRVTLEQATDEIVAHYKAARFPAGAPVADLCCGIGGDLLALAARGSATGIDRDAATAMLAAANLRAVGSASPHLPSEVRVADAEGAALNEFAAWHIDPDRRGDGRRTTRIEHYAPPLEALDRMLAHSPDAAIKLAPAAEVPESWQRNAELEWIGRDGQCRQQVAWLGGLSAEHDVVKATMLKRIGEPPRIVRGEQRVEVAAAPQIGRYVFEPDAAVLAAELAGALALELAIAPLAAGHVYLTGDAPLDDAALACFEVSDVLPLDVRKLRELFRQRGVGRLEVKVRGVKQDPAALRRQLALRGNASATLLVTRLGERIVAIVATRWLSG